jgi:hypothetical protein
MTDLTSAQKSGDEPITDNETMAALPEGSAVRTHNTIIRHKTDAADEWNNVLDSDEVLREGGGEVHLINVGLPSGRDQDPITDAAVLAALPEGAAVTTRNGIIRHKTHEADEWDFVLDSDEVLREGDGSVLLVTQP